MVLDQDHCRTCTEEEAGAYGSRSRDPDLDRKDVGLPFKYRSKCVRSATKSSGGYLLQSIRLQHEMVARGWRKR